MVPRLLVALAVVLLLPCTPRAETAEHAKQEVDKRLQQDELYELLFTFADTIDQIDRNYVDQISKTELLEAAIEGVLRKLDPYSSYIAPDEMNDFKRSVESEFAGVGVQLGVERGQITIISPLPDTPAHRAGALAGDRILAIDGVSTENMSLAEATKRIQGPEESAVALRVLHPLTNAREDLKLTRKRIKVDTVRGHAKHANGQWNYLLDAEHHIAYAHVTGFGRQTTRDLRELLERLTAEKAQALILDLRFNSGGFLRTAIEVADLFLEEGMIVSTQGRNIRGNTWKATEPGSFTKLPLVVLVNQFSASASEIVAAALQDHGRAVIVGQRSFGKASIQNVVHLEGGRSALKLTTGSYQRPNGNSIHRFPGAAEWGVRPNEGLEVVLTRDALRRLMAQHRLRDSGATDTAQAIPPDPQLALALAHLRTRFGKEVGAQP